jgi:hypothetical protein
MVTIMYRQNEEKTVSDTQPRRVVKFQVTNMSDFIAKLSKRNSDQVMLLNTLSDSDATHLEMQKNFKRELLSMIEENVELIMKNDSISLREFSQLFKVVSKLEILKLRTHPDWDRFWHKTRTSSVQEAMKLVRKGGLYVFERFKASFEKNNDLIGLKNFIVNSIQDNLFKAQRDNWTLSTTTDAYDYLHDIYLSIDETTNSYKPALESGGDPQHQENSPAVLPSTFSMLI